MRGPIRESWIENKVVSWSKKNGWLTFKFSSPAHRGVPDRIFIKDGVIVFIEFKAPGKKPSPLQEATFRNMGNAGATVAVFDDPDAAIRYLQAAGSGKC